VRLAIAVVLSAVPVAAQESSVADVAHRPGCADSPALLGRGHVQVEIVFTNEHEGGDSGTVRFFTARQSELQARVTSRFDVSISWDGFPRQRHQPRSQEPNSTMRAMPTFALVPSSQWSNTHEYTAR
jgi:hypothetical protein